MTPPWRGPCERDDSNGARRRCCITSRRLTSVLPLLWLISYRSFSGDERGTKERRRGSTHFLLQSSSLDRRPSFRNSYHCVAEGASCSARYRSAISLWLERQNHSSQVEREEVKEMLKGLEVLKLHEERRHTKNNSNLNSEKKEEKEKSNDNKRPRMMAAIKAGSISSSSSPSSNFSTVDALLEQASVLLELPRAASRGGGTTVVRLIYNRTHNLSSIVARHETRQVILFCVASGGADFSGKGLPAKLRRMSSNISQQLNPQHYICNVDEEEIFRIHNEVMPSWESAADFVDLLLSLPFPSWHPCEIIQQIKKRVLEDSAFRECVLRGEQRHASSLLGTGATESDMCTVSTDPSRPLDTEDRDLEAMLQGGPNKSLKIDPDEEEEEHSVNASGIMTSSENLIGPAAKIAEWIRGGC